MVTRLQEETREQAIARLAQKARESGVAIRRDRTGRYYVSSASQRGSWHYCTGVSCDCRGFATHGRCMHHSLLLVHLGWADEDPTPEPDGAFPSGKVNEPDSHFRNRKSGTFTDVKVDEPTPERAGVPSGTPGQAKTTCQWCNGQGSTPSTELFGGRRLDIRTTCWHCRGTGHEQLAA